LAVKYEQAYSMTRYCLDKAECAALSDDYDGYAVGFAYGLRLLQLCIVNANDVYGVRPGYDGFISWTDELSGLIDEGFEHIQRAVDAEDSGDAGAEKNGDCDWDPEVRSGRITLPELINLMRALAESLASALDVLPDVSNVPDMGDEEEERLEEEVASVAAKVREVGFEACGFLTGASLHPIDPKSPDVGKPGQQNVERMFGNAP
jgi:hypothetical protein